ncbi:MAG: VOC family protein [Cytophagaceae bacterium]|jgi:catechol 2,3-dioxygenase-like lactoylglutathione lyase family enzyme|nr:VOC family protein [Cytophagaceae bacterium]
MNLNQVTVPCLDLEKSIRFYQDLGLVLIVYAPPHYARFQCPQGTSTFSIQQADQHTIGQGIHVYFETETLDALVQTLLNKGYIFEEMPQDKPWLWREAHLLDPDKNHLVLYTAGTNRLNPPWRIR